jgi:predicted AlkP superfamily pyrophosphatase or phosphodiesterase
MKRVRMALVALMMSAGVSVSPTSGAVVEAGDRPFVLYISIDGLKPEAILNASEHGLHLPNLRAFLRDGMYSTGVHGVLPTVTYPSHMTLMTGVSPAKHGIYTNTTFDPFNRNERGWYWYAEDGKVPTLWAAAGAAGLKTANVYWPISVGAPIMFNLPQIWRTGTADDLKLQRALSTSGLEQQLTAALGAYPGGEDETVADDEIRARFAVKLMELEHPDFMTVYLTGLDTEQHKSGPFSAASNAVLERLDSVVGTLRAAADRVAPGRATVCVVSDHGFAPVAHDVNLYAAFLDADLFKLDESRHVASWEAEPWFAGGAAAVVLAHPDDPVLRARVGALLDKLASDPANGIDRIVGHDELVRNGGFPDATFLVALKIGYEMGLNFAGPVVTPPSNLGMHGYLPDRPEMRSTFLMEGPRVPHAKSLGEFDMRRIAPTLAAVLGVSLPDAELAALPLN